MQGRKKRSASCRTLTSAWIETPYSRRLIAHSGVALSRVRGLKLPPNGGECKEEKSRTLTSAWIETAYLVRGCTGYQVALSRVRGLKQSLRSRGRQ